MNPVKKIMYDLELAAREVTFGVITEGAFANLALHGTALLPRTAVAELIAELVKLRHEVGEATEGEAAAAEAPKSFNRAGKIAERNQKIEGTVREQRKATSKEAKIAAEGAPTPAEAIAEPVAAATKRAKKTVEQTVDLASGPRYPAAFTA